MDATRTRRLRDDCRQRWYAECRCRRFARFLHFPPEGDQAAPAKSEPLSGSAHTAEPPRASH